MAASDKQASFSVKLDDEVSDPADEAARAVEALRDRMASGEAAVKEMSSALRRLKGTTDEVKKAKADLKARIDAERNAISSSQLAMLKNADAAKKLAEREKALAKSKDAAKDRAQALGKAIDTAGGPVAALKAKLGTLGEVLGGAGGGMSAATLAAAGLVAGLVALAAATAAAVVGFAHFVISGANALRSANLFREAAAGSSENAKALGTQVEALARKVPTARGALNELATSLAKGGIQGQTLVDTLNAVGQANAAMGEDAGSKLRELVDRGRLTQRFAVNPLELQGTGLQFDDIAKELASSMHVGVAKAREALFQGAVKLGDGAEAMRKAVEKKFGHINLRQMLNLETIMQKLHEKFETLTEGVNIEPLLKAFATLAEIFDDTTVTGDSLKQLVTILGTGLADALIASIPIAKRFIQGLIIGALTAGIAFLTLRNQVRKTFGDVDVLKGVDTLAIAMTAGKVVVLGMAVGLAALVGWMTLLGAAVYLVVKPFVELGKNIKLAYDYISTLDWAALGSGLVDGLIGGIKSRVSNAANAIKDLASKIKTGFTSALDMHSPSKVFAGYGENTVAGYEQGIEAGTPDAAKALDGMADAPKGAGGRGGGSISISIPVTIQVSGGADMARQVSDPGFLAPLTKALEQALIAAGIPVLATT